MSKIFQIIHRDAAARIGKLTLDREILTPAVIKIHERDSPIIDSGSLWKRTGSDAPAMNNKIIILPHRSLPLHAGEDIITPGDFRHQICMCWEQQSSLKTGRASWLIP
ncbi:MAG: hypothetical protein OIN88_13495 [Candidatus Methanoperedens sp.]|nr:hypothetical protein [Candidatus Methanoperedens sp.]